MKKYIGAILTVTSFGMLFNTMLHFKEQAKKVPVLQHQVDSCVNTNDSLSDLNDSLVIKNGKLQYTKDSLAKKLHEANTIIYSSM
jgi:hypothetical protein